MSESPAPNNKKRGVWYSGDDETANEPPNPLKRDGPSQSSRPNQLPRQDVLYFIDTPFALVANQRQMSAREYSYSQDKGFSAPIYCCAPPHFLEHSSSTAVEGAADLGKVAKASLNVNDGLQSIKLLRVVSWNFAPNCTLETFAWDSCPDFIALSYVWGTDTPNNPILVNDKEHLVQYNLHSALRHFARKKLSSYLWADAICIDQTNEAEKPHVVQHMGDIFKRASKMIAWLDPFRTSSQVLVQVSGISSTTWNISGLSSGTSPEPVPPNSSANFPSNSPRSSSVACRNSKIDLNPVKRTVDSLSLPTPVSPATPTGGASGSFRRPTSPKTSAFNADKNQSQCLPSPAPLSSSRNSRSTSFRATPSSLRLFCDRGQITIFAGLPLGPLRSLRCIASSFTRPSTRPILSL